MRSMTAEWLLVPIFELVALARDPQASGPLLRRGIEALSDEQT